MTTEQMAWSLVAFLASTLTLVAVGWIARVSSLAKRIRKLEDDALATQTREDLRNDARAAVEAAERIAALIRDGRGRETQEGP